MKAEDPRTGLVSAAKHAGLSDMAVSVGENVANPTHPHASSARSHPSAKLAKVEIREYQVFVSVTCHAFELAYQ